MKMGLLREMFRGALDLLYPPHCEACDRPLEDGAHLYCAACDRALPRIHPPRCSRCSFPFDGAIEGEFECHDCRERLFSFEACVAPFRFRDAIRKAVLDLKYHSQPRLAAPLGSWLADTVAGDNRTRGIGFDTIVPVPLHPARQRDRGFNQAELLAHALASRLRAPVSRELRRIRYTSTQTAHDREERMENLRGAFQLRNDTRLREKTVLLVDDVFTTGSTIDACAQILRRGGAARVFAATVARG